ncbi:hypothetical protein [Anabaena lutea]|uniref:Anacyclamide n=1 Tax=Anabaena lutea FACHB-196 TaxID=2692881 RepID=A0ABR8F8R8_9NOST|nr:hypothetical protein [Anabaena lutea]MBD2566583.1 hypothetical protein [Anabaena lutea FACHB-196]
MDTQTVQVHSQGEPNDEELSDLAATQIICNGGIVHTVESADMPAVFRD